MVVVGGAADVVRIRGARRARVQAAPGGIIGVRRARGVQEEGVVERVSEAAREDSGEGVSGID